MAEQINEENIDTIQWLVAAGSKQAWKEQAKQILEEEELKHCTFKPNIQHKEGHEAPRTANQADKGQAPSNEKYKQLYALAKPQKDKTDKTKEDYEFERNQQECTFQPKMNARAKQSVQVESGAVTSDKAVQKQIDRLNKAREEKERIKMYTERGAMPPIKQPADLVNVSTISATSKRPTQAAQQQ